jgi:hypothetical protein
MQSNRRRLAVCAAVLALSTAAHAGDKKLMHCFAFTSIQEATPADWKGFFKASDALPRKINGVNKVWYGKLSSPLFLYGVSADADGQKKLRAGDTVAAPVKRVVREWGGDAYSKVRVEGTTTFNFIGR